MSSKDDRDEIVICMKRIFFYLIFSCFFIIFQYYDDVMQKLYFLMQCLPICYRIRRSSYLKYGGPDPARPRAPKSGGSADPADPVVPTPLVGLQIKHLYECENKINLSQFNSSFHKFSTV